MKTPLPPALILAGGKGTRLGGRCRDCPKPMLPVAGAPFLAHVVDLLRRQGVTRFLFLTGYLGEQVEAYFAARCDAGVSYACLREEQLLGTGGAVRAALAQRGIRERFLLLNGDSACPFDLGALLDAAADGGGALVAVRVEESSRFGTLEVDARGRLRAFREKEVATGPALINSGIYCLAPELFEPFPADRPASLEREYFPRWLGAGAAFGVVLVPGPFLDIGTPESLARADAFLRSWRHGGR
jgi:NDP-sugar pyrophosphorylase family protein